MDKQEFLNNSKEKFPDAVRETIVLKRNRATIEIDSSAILEISEYLLSELDMRFIIATAVHTKRGIEILYHYADDTDGNIFNINVILPVENPQIESLANRISAANWIEREMHEIMGITFTNHPEPETLISEGNWAEGVYPYRKDLTQQK